MVVGDSLGSLLVYDALCLTGTNNSSGDDSSINSCVSATNVSLSPNLNTANSDFSSNNLNSQYAQSKSASLSITNPIISVNDVDLKASPLLSADKNSKQVKRNLSGHSGDSSGSYSIDNNNNNNSNSTANTTFLTPSSFVMQNSITSTDEERLEFDVTHFFVFGSPLGLVLAYKKLSNNFSIKILRVFSILK